MLHSLYTAALLTAGRRGLERFEWTLCLFVKHLYAVTDTALLSIPDPYCCAENTRCRSQQQLLCNPPIHQSRPRGCASG